MDEERWAEAIKKFEAALKLLPKPRKKWTASTWLYASIGDACFQLRRYDLAGDAMQHALSSPEAYANPFIHLRLGESLFERGEVHRAGGHLAQAYMLAGKDIFKQEDPKYFALVKKTIRTSE